MTAVLLALVVLVGLVVLLAATSVRVLREYERAVVFRLGRLIGQRGPGSVVGGIEGPAPAPVVPANTTAPAEAPATPPASGNKTP